MMRTLETAIILIKTVDEFLGIIPPFIKYMHHVPDVFQITPVISELLVCLTYVGPEYGRFKYLL